MTRRRDFLKKSIIGSAGIALGGMGFSPETFAAIVGANQPINFNDALNKTKPELKFGLVTYQWGKDWDLPTLISNCEKNWFPGS